MCPLLLYIQKGCVMINTAKLTTTKEMFSDGLFIKITPWIITGYDKEEFTYIRYLQRIDDTGTIITEQEETRYDYSSDAEIKSIDKDGLIKYVLEIFDSAAYTVKRFTIEFLSDGTFLNYITDKYTPDLHLSDHAYSPEDEYASSTVVVDWNNINIDEIREYVKTHMRATIPFNLNNEFLKQYILTANMMYEANMSVNLASLVYAYCVGKLIEPYEMSAPELLTCHPNSGILYPDVSAELLRNAPVTRHIDYADTEHESAIGAILTTCAVYMSSIVALSRINNDTK